MSDRIQQAFDTIKAEEGLKEQTLEYIYGRSPVVSKRKKRHPVRRLAFALASIFLFVSAAGVSYHAYASPAAYVDVDVNPSIELTINRFDRVIGVYAYNEDGRAVLSDVNLKNKTAQEAIDLLLLAIEKYGYLENSSLLSITVQSNSQQEPLLESLQHHVGCAVSAHHAEMNQEIFAVDAQTKEEAHRLNVSPAQYLAIQELLAVDPSASVEECQDNTITEIRKITSEHHHQKIETSEDTIKETETPPENTVDETENEQDTNNNKTCPYCNGCKK